MSELITHIYVYVVKEDGVLRVKGVRREKQGKAYLFDENDQDLAKHLALANEIKNATIKNFKNVKLQGQALLNYFDTKLSKFIFNGKTLDEDKEQSMRDDDIGNITESNADYL